MSLYKKTSLLLAETLGLFQGRVNRQNNLAARIDHLTTQGHALSVCGAYSCESRDVSVPIPTEEKHRIIKAHGTFQMFQECWTRHDAMTRRQQEKGLEEERQLHFIKLLRNPSSVSLYTPRKKWFPRSTTRPSIILILSRLTDRSRKLLAVWHLKQG